MRYRGQLLQDEWIAEQVFPGLTDGYFLDVGAYDGKSISNTLELEKVGWNGICIEPSPVHYPGVVANRKCHHINVAISSSSGMKDYTSVHTRKHGGYSSLTEINKVRQHFPDLSEEHITRSIVQCKTLEQVLIDFDAPEYIHYMSLDVEGSELECLKSCDFSKRRFGALTIEHNRIPDHRRAIRTFMQEQGYLLARQVEFEDWFLSCEFKGSSLISPDTKSKVY